jgi:hypothetical protein
MKKVTFSVCQATVDDLATDLNTTCVLLNLVSSIVNGKRFSTGEATPTISQAQAKKLGEIFNISLSVFI